MWRGRLATALIVGLTAGAARALLPDVKTRLQLFVALALAALFELLLRRLLGQRPSIAGFLLNVLAIIIAMVAIKIAIDGRPHYPHWLLHLAGMIGITL
ncbi:hypothetical protein BFL28_05560 [Sphingomonas turrisvirgatae]|uniref:Uncharacterized protein n=1 Tax=Sphingomonas turrisvirgatae TaxID=1888892 RepID=A0A1E3LUF9_9SPHN|nr:hypothetical protein BFL28_05560 [Sphingomonas turrisvirgatae]